MVFRTTQRRWVCKECLDALGENQIQQMLEKIPLAEDIIFRKPSINF
ncbi:MAG: hypothetical protein Q7R70_06445 [Candidatus Diapherotrites archaeon]|nr:hypothetical protein [Candidatus Diapherotrites archaeon]